MLYQWLQPLLEGKQRGRKEEGGEEENSAADRTYQ